MCDGLSVANSQNVLLRADLETLLAQRGSLDALRSTLVHLLGSDTTEQLLPAASQWVAAAAGSRPAAAPKAPPAPSLARSPSARGAAAGVRHKETAAVH